MPKSPAAKSIDLLHQTTWFFIKFDLLIQYFIHLNYFCMKNKILISSFSLAKDQSKLVWLKDWLRASQYLIQRPFFQSGRWKGGIDTYLNYVFDKIWNDFLQNLAADFQAGIGIDLYEPRFKIFINHKIVSEQLERVNSILRVQNSLSYFILWGHDFDSLEHHFLNLRKDLRVEVELFFVFE